MALNFLLLSYVLWHRLVSIIKIAQGDLNEVSLLGAPSTTQQFQKCDREGDESVFLKPLRRPAWSASLERLPDTNDAFSAREEDRNQVTVALFLSKIG